MEDAVYLSIKGGFGNQLFQYASAFSLAKRLSVPLYLEISFFEEDRFKGAWKLPLLMAPISVVESTKIEHLRSLTTDGKIWKRLMRILPFHNAYKRKTHWMDVMDFRIDEQFDHLKGPILLDGWFLKPLYFHSVRGDLLSLFRPKFTLSESCQRNLEKVKSVNSVAIHVRRTDYVNNPLFVNLDESYYSKAIEIIQKFTPDAAYFVFSDDIDWCKGLFGALQLACEFVQCDGENGDLEDFEVMKSCRHQVIANSSFSWWAAYLNENEHKVIVAPKVWYKDPKLQHCMDSGDAFLMDWICVEY